MSEYTPTTEEVRAQWTYNYPDYDNTDEQFDRWLQRVKAESWDEGREYGERRANREIPFQSNPYLEETDE